MASVGIKLETPQAVKLQGLIQNELADREWAERSDTVMAEYVTVMLANSKTGDQINEELVDLIGSEYDQSFVTWLFDTVRNLDAPAAAAPVVEAPIELLPVTSSPAPPAASSRLVSSALASATSEENKRKRSPGPAALDDQRNKRVAAASGAAPVQGVPRGNGGPMRGGRPPFNGPGGNFRGGPPGGPGGNFRGGPPGPGFRPNQGFNAAMAAASQGRGGNREAQMMAEMLQAQQAQMMQMQAMMNTMAQMNQGPQQQPNVRPQRPPKIPAGVKLGSHTMGGTPAPLSTGPIPTRPTDSALCRFSVGCSNARCPYSHPSPVADELSGVVLSADACPEGVKCADKDCIKSHVSPAVVHGDKAGQSRMLCKFQNCNNPSCPFRHEDAQGNAIPPPALSNPEQAKKPEGAKSTMDGALESSPFSRPCKFGAACTRADCKFQHANRAKGSGHKTASFAPNPSAKPFSPAERPFAVDKTEGVVAGSSEAVNVEQVV